jgi:CDP-paratose 2-epimerase
VAGEAFNIGGGPSQAISLLDLIDTLERRLDRKLPLQWGDWRPGDQRVYVSDVRRVESELGWRPATSVADGTRRLRDWLETRSG